MHLGLIGYGSIATGLIERLAQTRVSQITVLVRETSPSLTQTSVEHATANPPIRFLTDIDEFIASEPDLVAECAGHSAVSDIITKLLLAGIDTIIASIGALADDSVSARIDAAATQGRSRVILPSGAIGGLDLLRAISLAGDLNVTYRGIKPPAAWVGSPADDLVDLASLDCPTNFFSGTGREAALAFPKNANVVAALALAGAGFDRMRVELIADSTARANQHTYDVASPLCQYSMTIEGKSSAANARTSATTVLSILHEILTYRTS